MSFRNPPVPWSELERRLSDRTRPGGSGVEERAGNGTHGRAAESGMAIGDGGDSPAWSRKRERYEPPAIVPRSPVVSYAELHCHSNFSFLDGASHPEELVEEAARLGLEALALTDHDGFYGVVRFAEAARALGLATVFGAELTLGRAASPAGAADPGLEPGRPPESHLVVLARDPRGYALLARAISEAQLRGEKGVPRATLADLVAIGGAGAPAADQGRWTVLTGCRKGAVPAALVADGPAAARRELHRLVEGFGRDHVAVELWDHGDPLDSARNDALAEVAVGAGVELVATNNVHYATPARRPLATALAAVRARRSLDELDGWLPAASGAHLRSGAEQARRFARYPGVVERAAELARACAFDLALVAPNLPPFPCPDGLDEMGHLRRLAEAGARRRYGPRDAEWVPGAWAQIDHELDVIEALGFPGYFLIVWDIVEFCRRHDIYCQGRGSAANSAVCYALGVTKADAVSLGLLFERFLSPERDGPPDIDLDIESGRREEVIQYVYERYGRHDAAQVANVITYRARSAVRDMAKALGYAPGQQDAWSKQLDRWSGLAGQIGAGQDRAALDVPDAVLDLAAQVEHFPRHLGIHSGGHGAVRPSGDRGVPGRVGAHGGPQRPAVGQGRLRGGGAGEVRPARPRHALGPARRRRPGGRAPRRHRRPGHPAPGPGRLRHALRRPTPSACSRSRAGPRWRPCPACGPAPSTTWWSRSPSSAPAPSRAGRCTPTSAAATARSRSPTCTPCSSRPSPRPSACRCSRSS